VGLVTTFISLMPPHILLLILLIFAITQTLNKFLSGLAVSLPFLWAVDVIGLVKEEPSGLINGNFFNRFIKGNSARLLINRLLPHWT
jgi:hypothetical protein